MTDYDSLSGRAFDAAGRELKRHERCACADEKEEHFHQWAAECPKCHADAMPGKAGPARLLGHYADLKKMLICAFTGSVEAVLQVRKPTWLVLECPACGKNAVCVDKHEHSRWTCSERCFEWDALCQECSWGKTDEQRLTAHLAGPYNAVLHE